MLNGYKKVNDNIAVKSANNLNTAAKDIITYSQGSLVTLSANFTLKDGSPYNPANPTVSVLYNGSIILEQASMSQIANGWFYYNLDSTALNLQPGIYYAVYSAVILDEEVQGTELFQITAITSTVIVPTDPISMLRIDLRDYNPNLSLRVWSDVELQEYLNQSLEALNTFPPLSAFTFEDIPNQWIETIKKGAKALALYAKAVEVAHQPVVFTAKGMSINKPAQATFYKVLGDQFWMQFLDTGRQAKRTAGLVKTSYIVTANTPFVSTPPIRACYDLETEILTKRGWKEYNKLNNNDKILTFNIKNKNFEYQEYIEKFDYLYNGKIYKIENKKNDICITPEHKILIKNNNDFLFSKIKNLSGEINFINYDTEIKVNVYEDLKIVNYYGNVFCLTVPNGFFVTRRNGKIAVQGNSSRRWW